jgi:hypothetical protein
VHEVVLQNIAGTVVVPAAQCGIAVEPILLVVLAEQCITLDNICGGMHLIVLPVEVEIVVRMYRYVVGSHLLDIGVQAAVLITIIAVQIQIAYGVVVDLMDMMQDMSLIVVHIVQNQKGIALNIEL